MRFFRGGDKLGGNSINKNRANLLWNCINTFNLVDLSFKESKYTWTNKNNNALILERLNRYLANDSWMIDYPNATITHLPHTHSDYCPLLLQLDKAKAFNNNKSFRLKPMWCSHFEFKNLINSAFSPHLFVVDAISSFQCKAFSL